MTDSAAGFELLDSSTRNGWLVYNDSIYRAEALGTMVPVIDRDLTNPSTVSSPSEGDLYIAASGADGDWSDHDLELMQWKNNTWESYEPLDGTIKYLTDETKHIYWTGAAWADL